MSDKVGGVPLFSSGGMLLGERRRDEVMGKTRYKLGGETTCAHPYCPARVLLRGRCRKECSYWSVCSRGGSPARELGIDHVGVEQNPDGTQTFVSCSHGIDENAEMRIKAFCERHGLSIDIDKDHVHEYGPWSYELRMKITKKDSLQ